MTAGIPTVDQLTNLGLDVQTFADWVNNQTGQVTNRTGDTFDVLQVLVAAAVSQVNPYGLGINSAAPTLSDLDVITTRSGFYATNGSTTGTFPTVDGGTTVTGFGFLRFERRDASQVRQTYTTVGNGGAQANRVFRRSYNPTAGAWLPWVETFDTGNILGTVSQSGGTPTGRVIERGSNANGEYVRFADGTQICTHVVSGVNINTASGVLFTATVNWTFPAVFVGTPNVLPSTRNELGAFGGGCTISTTAASASVFSDATRGNVDVSLTAIGRWF